IYVGQTKQASLPEGYWQGGQLDDHDRWIVFNGGGNQDLDKWTSWDILLMGTIFKNHAGIGLNEQNSSNISINRTRKVFHCPIAPQGAPALTDNTYCCHPRIMPALGQRDQLANQVYNTPTGSYGAEAILVPYKLSQIKRQQEIYLIFDAS